MLRNKKKRQIFKTIFTTSIILIVFAGLYKMYQNIEITDSEDKKEWVIKIADNYSAEKTKVSTINEQNVENIYEKSVSTADMIENISKSVCGISKLSNAGGSILSTATETELGLGTGIIVSSDGYILSNSHVTGERFSTCYVTIEDKDTYTGKVVWSDASLD